MASRGCPVVVVDERSHPDRTDELQTPKQSGCDSLLQRSGRRWYPTVCAGSVTTRGVSRIRQTSSRFAHTPVGSAQVRYSTGLGKATGPWRMRCEQGSLLRRRNGLSVSSAYRSASARIHFCNWNPRRIRSITLSQYAYFRMTAHLEADDPSGGDVLS